MDIVNDKSIKAMTLNRLNGDFIDDSLNLVGDSFALIVADEHGLKILSSYLTMTDVLNRGIFSIESIRNDDSKKRNAFPNYHVLFFIAPTIESCSQIAKDFQDIKNPMYSRIHIFFTHPAKDEVLSSLVSNGVIKRTIVCKELNVSYITKGPNVFDLNMKSGLKIFKMPSDSQIKLLKEISDRLFTVCATLNISPFVQYQASSKLCTDLTSFIEPLLETLHKTKNIERKGLLLLTDRTIDPTTPFLHDYNYEAVVYDLMDIKNDVIEIGNKKNKLNDKDELWSTYRSLHIAQVFDQLPKDLETFQKSDVTKARSSHLDSFEEMSHALSTMSEYKLKTGLFSFHLNLAQEINAKYKLNNIFEMIELEQDIVAGENEQGPIPNKDIFKNFTLLKSRLQENQRNDFMRLLLIIFLNINIGEKDFNVMKGKLSEEEQRIFDNLTLLGIMSKNKAPSNTKDTLTTQKAKLKNLNLKVNQQMNYSALRAQGHLEYLVQKASSYELDLNQYPIKNWDMTRPLPKVQKKHGTKNLFGGSIEKDEEEDFGGLIMFTIGGIANNEIAAIEKLSANNLVNHSIYVGSTNILTALSYMNELKEVNNGYNSELSHDLNEPRSSELNYY